jgi:hypothetical protein
MIANPALQPIAEAFFVWQRDRRTKRVMRRTIVLDY